MFRCRPSWSRILHRFKIRSKTVLGPGISAQSHCVRKTCLISFSDSATISHPRIRPWRFWRSHRLARTFWFRVHEQTGARHVIAISAAATNTQRSTRGGRRHRTANYLWRPQETPAGNFSEKIADGAIGGKLCPERRWNWRKLEIDPFPSFSALWKAWKGLGLGQGKLLDVTRWQRNHNATQCRCSKRLLIIYSTFLLTILYYMDFVQSIICWILFCGRIILMFWRAVWPYKYIPKRYCNSRQVLFDSLACEKHREQNHFLLALLAQRSEPPTIYYRIWLAVAGSKEAGSHAHDPSNLKHEMGRETQGQAGQPSQPGIFLTFNFNAEFLRRIAFWTDVSWRQPPLKDMRPSIQFWANLRNILKLFSGPIRFI